MTRALDDFLAWLRQHADEGQRVLADDLGLSPTDAFYKYNTGDYVRDFYARIDRWTAWRMRLTGGMRKRLLEAEHIVTVVETQFSTDRFLLFRMRHANGRDIIGVDLRPRDIFLDSSGWVEMRTLFAEYRAEPLWKTIRDSIAKDLRSFVADIEAHPFDLVLAGEPRSPKLEDALQILTALRYVDVGLVRSDLVAAEGHFRSGRAKDVSSAFRRAVEQVIHDAYREGVKRGAIPAPTGTPDMYSQAEAIGKTLATKATARQAYGAYALLSELGSHTGPIAADELEAAWHSGLAGIFMLARRLKT